MESITRLNSLTQKVEYILQRYPATRNSDIELQAQLCTQFYPPIESPIWNWRDFVSVMRSLPTLDHIARARRKVIQNHKYTKYLPTSREVAETRRINMAVWEQYGRQSAQVMDRNYPPEIQSNLDRTGRTGVDD